MLRSLVNPDTGSPVCQSSSHPIPAPPPSPLAHKVPPTFPSWRRPFWKWEPRSVCLWGLGQGMLPPQSPDKGSWPLGWDRSQQGLPFPGAQAKVNSEGRGRKPPSSPPVTTCWHRDTNLPLQLGRSGTGQPPVWSRAKDHCCWGKLKSYSCCHWGRARKSPRVQASVGTKSATTGRRPGSSLLPPAHHRY